VTSLEIDRYVDRIWNIFWSAGISNPLEIVDQITNLLYIRILDESQREIDEGIDQRTLSDGPLFGQHDQDFRWSYFSTQTPSKMFSIVRDAVFPWLRRQRSDATRFFTDMRNARFAIPTPNALASIVEVLSAINVADSNSCKEFYETILERLMTSSSSGHLFTPRFIAQMMVEMMAPVAQDQVCDPACGTGGMLVAAAEHLNRTQEDNSVTFHGFEIDSYMARISEMNMIINGVKSAEVDCEDSLSLGDSSLSRYSLVLSNPPFGGRVDVPGSGHHRLFAETKQLELLFLQTCMQLLKRGGRAAILVPRAVLFGTSHAHRILRRVLVEKFRLDAVIELPKGLFKPYTGIATAILCFSRTDDSTEFVWFYSAAVNDDVSGEMNMSSKGTDSNSEGKSWAGEAELPIDCAQILARWNDRYGSERRRLVSDQSFCIAKAEIAAQEFDLTADRYRRVDELKHLKGQGSWRLGDLAYILVGSVGKPQVKNGPNVGEIDRMQRVLHPSLLASPLPNIDTLPVRIDGRQPNFRLQVGDIVGRDLAASRNWTVIPAPYEGVQVAQGIIVIRLFRNVLPPEYIALYLSSVRAEKAMPLYEVIPRIRRRDFADVLIPRCDGDYDSVKDAISRLGEGLAQVEKIKRELTDSRELIFAAGRSSERHLRLEQAADLSSLIGQSLRKQGDPYKAFQETYPYAIARSVRKFKHSLALAERHEAAIQCAESLILSLGIFSLAIAIYRGRKSLPQIVEWMKSVQRNGPSLGQWVGVIRTVGADARENGDRAGGLAEATAAGKRGTGLLAYLDALVTHRNRIRHGAGPRSRAETERSLAEIEIPLYEALSSSAFIARSQWIYMDRLHWIPEVGKYRISGLSLMGDHPDFEAVECETDRPLADNGLYISSSDGDMIPMFPFCVLDDCPACLAPELYYPDRLTDSAALLKSLDRGHEMQSEAVLKGFDSLP
jgi:tRNA1(Val) A37 N6-methylase TrmN6